MVWSKEPPRMEMSACMPLLPRSRRSTDGARRRAASSVWRGAAAWVFRSKSGVCICTVRVGADCRPEMPTSRMRSVFMTADVSAGCADAPHGASSRIDIPTQSTPMVTQRCMLAKADQPLRSQRRQRPPAGSRFVWMCSIVFEIWVR